MGYQYQHWNQLSSDNPGSFSDLEKIIKENRDFYPISQLNYGDHGLEQAAESVLNAIKSGKKIALYADYDVDGTMSCVSWIWFLDAIGYHNYVHYIPCRFKEGYGLNLQAIKHLIESENAELIITMDTGITANKEAEYCKSRGVEFICTDHHKIQPDKMPDCIILNPRQHPEESYRELCGCGITFVLLRKIGKEFDIPNNIWTDILALVGFATICDVVPLNSVNHKLANVGVEAFMKSQRPILRSLREAGISNFKIDEKDVGFRIGPRINAVGRLEHADKVIEAFLNEEPEELIDYMDRCNDKRKALQERIFQEASEMAKKFHNDPILFMGGDWHPGVVGIAASKITELFWKPTWLFNNTGTICKGSARSVAGFDVTDAMGSAKALFDKFGGHQAAGGFSFDGTNANRIRDALVSYANSIKVKCPNIWESKISYDCSLDKDFLSLKLPSLLESFKPFGHGFDEPLFKISASIRNVRFYNDKKTGEPKHTAVEVLSGSQHQKILFFNKVYPQLKEITAADFLVHPVSNSFRGKSQLSLIGRDWTHMQ